MQSHERDDRHSRTHTVRTTAEHQNGHSNSGRGNEKAPRGEPAGLLAYNLCSMAKIICCCNSDVKKIFQTLMHTTLRIFGQRTGVRESVFAQRSWSPQ